MKIKGLKSQLPANMATNVAYFVISLLINLFMVPYYIRHLGVASYGLIPLVTSLTAYLGLVTMSINAAVSRYLVIDIQNQDHISANLVFNTAFFSLTMIALALAVIAGILAWYVPVIFNVPYNLAHGARCLFFLAVLSFLLGVISANFSVSCYAYNRLDIQNYINMLVLGARVLPVFVLFTFLGAKLQWVGVAIFFASLTSLALNIIGCRKLAPFLQINIKAFDLKKVMPLTRLSWWLTMNKVGALLFLSTDIVIVNLIFGSVIAGKYGAVMQWPLLLRTFASVFAGLFAPMILIISARGDIDKMIFLCVRAIKYLGLGMALPIGLICGFRQPIVSLWLGAEFTEYSLLLVVMCFHLSINLAITPLFSVQTASNNVKLPGIVTIIGGVGMLLLAVILAKLSPLGVYGVPLAGAIMLTSKDVFFTTIYVAKILDVSKLTFLKPLVGGIVGTMMVWAACEIVNIAMQPDSWVSLILFSVIISIAYFMVVYLKNITQDEKQLILSLVRP